MTQASSGHDPARRMDFSWPAFFMRVTAGLVFFMAGYWKVFVMSPAVHARKLFLDQFADSWIPHPLLWVLGAFRFFYKVSRPR